MEKVVKKSVVRRVERIRGYEGLRYMRAEGAESLNDRLVKFFKLDGGLQVLYLTGFQLEEGCVSGGHLFPTYDAAHRYSEQEPIHICRQLYV